MGDHSAIALHYKEERIAVLALANDLLVLIKDMLEETMTYFVSLERSEVVELFDSFDILSAGEVLVLPELLVNAPEGCLIDGPHEEGSFDDPDAG